MAMPFRGLAPVSMADAVSKFLIESLHDAHSDYFLVPFGQKFNKSISNRTNIFERLLASLRELKVCINLYYLTSLRASPFSRSDSIKSRKE
jgi:hypothetical protein